MEQAETKGGKSFVEFSCVGDLDTTNAAGQVKHIEKCKEQFVTGDDLYKPEDLAVPGKPATTVQRTLNPPTMPPFPNPPLEMKCCEDLRKHAVLCCLEQRRPEFAAGLCVEC